MCLDVSTSTSQSTTSLYEVVITFARNQLVNLVLVLGEVVVYLPVPCLVLDRANGCCELKTSVVQ